MKDKYRLGPFITFLFLIPSFIHAQIIADFSADPSAGCTPMKVYFTNLSSGSGALTYLWYLGEQQGISDLEDPQATYYDPGTYDIKLIVDNGTEKDSITKSIVVYQSPVAAFTADAKGCVPDTIQFTDLSVAGDGAIISWNWDFRSGTIDTRQNPSYVYAAEGNYDVFLKVTDANGCEASLEKVAYIDVANPPTASYTISPASACIVPVTVQFANTSAGKGNLTYEWDFGDNTSSSVRSPSKTYTQFGAYDVQLVVNSNYGCSDTAGGIFSASDVIARGTLTQGGSTIVGNDTICTGQVNFASTSSGSDQVLWKFGDGKTSISKSGFHVYSQGGSYTVLLIASPGNTCADTVVWNFYMEEPRAGFSMSSTYSCKSPALVTFTDSSFNAVGWEWTFSDGTKATTANTSKTYTLPAETDPYRINTEVIFNTMLTVTSRNGCKNSIIKPFRIRKPTALFSIDSAQGCFPLEIRFSDQSLSVEPITNWEWIFGDGHKSSGSTDAAVHSYLTDGVFLSRLVITNNLLCTDTSYIIPIRVGKILSPDFLISKTQVCPGEVIQFSDNTPQSTLIQGWHYTIDGASINADPDEPDPLLSVNADSGTLDVGLQVNYNGCISSVLKKNALRNQGAVSDFSYAFSCDDPFIYHFTDLSRGAESLTWDFGDNTSGDVTPNPVHTYAAEGNYRVELIAFRGMCADTFRREIKVRQPGAKLSGDTIACMGAPVILRGAGSYSRVDYCFEKYMWVFGDTIQNILTRSDSIIHTFYSRGTFPVIMVTRYDNECIDADTMHIRVHGPYAGFTPDTAYGCSPFEVNFTDNSVRDAYPIRQWHWDFDDGNDTTYTVKSAVINHRFGQPDVFNVQLTVTDTVNCSGSFTHVIASANPDAGFRAEKPLNCTGAEMKFYYDYATGDSVIWDFGDGTLSGSDTIPVTHAFLTGGNKQVTLTIYKFGCSDTYTNPDGYIRIQQPDASFAVSDTDWNCYPKEIVFRHDPVDSIIQSGTWDFGYGNSTSEYASERRFNYPRPGDYYPSLSIMTTYGCRDTAVQHINITGPTGSFSIRPESRKACRGDEITLQIGETHNVFDFEWDLGDGRFLKGDTVSFRYDRMGTLFPKLLLYGDSGICKPPPVVDSVLIYEVIAGIMMQDTGFCDQYEIHFADTSTGNTLRTWTFSHGVTGTEEEIVLRFSPGSYTVELLVMNDIGCSDTATADFIVHALPDLVLSGDTLICEGDTAMIFATGGDVIRWTPPEGLSDTTSFNPLAYPTFTTIYTAESQSLSTGCRNAALVTIMVQPEFDIILNTEDTSIIIGETVTIHADSLHDVTYSWSPAEGLSCIACASPVAQPMQSTVYTLTVEDTSGCFSKTYNLHIEVVEAYSLEVPTAFTPNGDTENDVVYVKGWGIRKLVEFRIYNRWGNEVFFSDDLNRGWDGMYKGKIQNIDTYMYTVTVELYNGSLRSKKGTINLLR